MTINELHMNKDKENNTCIRCHSKANFLESLKKCFYCHKSYCNQCWIEFQVNKNSKIFIDLRRICLECMKSVLQHTVNNDSKQQNQFKDEDFQLALAMSLSQNEADERIKQQKRKLEDIVEPRTTIIKEILVDNERLLQKTAAAIASFMNRAKSNYQRNRDAIGDTALLSSFISLQTCATDLEQVKYEIDHQRQHFETLQEKLSALRDAREALNVLRFEHAQQKQQIRERLEQQNRVLMMQKVADLRQFKHNQIANFQQDYFQRLLQEEQEMNQRLRIQQIRKETEFGQQQQHSTPTTVDNTEQNQNFSNK